jgi:AcrR family transcriptional regulator
MPRSSQEKSLETRANIVESAYRLFIERGYNATAMREISKNAGVTVGAIYNHFANKEEIWLEVLVTRHPYHEFMPVLHTAKGETTAEIVYSMASGLNRELLKRPDLLNLMFIEIVEFNAKHVPVIYKEIMPELMKIGSVFKKRIHSLRDFPVPILVRSFAGLFFSYYITGLFIDKLEGFTSDESTLQHMVDLYLFGILADDDPLRRTNE